MKKETGTEIKVGVTIFVAALLFLFVIIWAKNFSLNPNRETLTVQFPNISGLHLKDNVTVNGVSKGFVDGIKVKGNGVLLKLVFTEPVDLREDAKFSIVMLDLMGGKKVEITPGVSEKKLDFSVVQKGKFLGDISTTMAMMTNVEEDLVGIIHDTKKITESLNKILGQQNLSDKLNETFTEVNSTMQEVKRVISENRTDFSRLLSNSANLTDSLSLFWKNNNQEMLKALNSVSTTLVSADSLFKKLNNIVDETKSSKNNAGKLLYDKDFMEKLTKTLNQLNQLVEIVNKQLKNEGLNVKTHIF